MPSVEAVYFNDPFSIAGGAIDPARVIGGELL